MPASLASVVDERSQLAGDLLDCLPKIRQGVLWRPHLWRRTGKLRKEIGVALDQIENRTRHLDDVHFPVYLSWREVAGHLHNEAWLRDNGSAHTDRVAHIAGAIVMAVKDRYGLTDRLERWLWRRLTAPRTIATAGAVLVHLHVVSLTADIAVPPTRADRIALENRYNVKISIVRPKSLWWPAAAAAAAAVALLAGLVVVWLEAGSPQSVSAPQGGTRGVDVVLKVGAKPRVPPTNPPAVPRVPGPEPLVMPPGALVPPPVAPLPVASVTGPKNGAASDPPVAPATKDSDSAAAGAGGRSQIPLPTHAMFSVRAVVIGTRLTIDVKPSRDLRDCPELVCLGLVRGGASGRAKVASNHALVAIIDEQQHRLSLNESQPFPLERGEHSVYIAVFADSQQKGRYGPFRFKVEDQ